MPLAEWQWEGAVQKFSGLNSYIYIADGRGFRELKTS